MSGPDARAVPSTVVVCAGSDCAKDERRAFRDLVSSLAGAGATVAKSTCLGVCHGPVVVLDPTGRRPVVVERLRKRKAIRSLVGGLSSSRADVTGGARIVAKKRAKKAIRRARAHVS